MNLLQRKAAREELRFFTESLRGPVQACAVCARTVWLSTLLCLASAVALAAEDLPQTPVQPRGPFYPQTPPAERDNDLTRVGDRTAQGEPLLLQGRVLNKSGQGLPGVRVEIWQTNAAGRYHHPAGRSPGQVDPGFQGWGETSTDAAGNYEFVTVRPAAYDGRAPHIHFAVTAPGQKTFYTQLYFSDEEDNARDALFSELTSEERARLLAKPQRPAPDQPVTAAFEIVLPW